MSKLLWLPVYVLTCGLVMGLVLAGATYWNWEIGLYGGLGGGAYGVLGWALIVFGGKRRLSYLVNYEAALDLGIGRRKRAEEAEMLLGRTLAYLAHKPFDSITVCELYDDIQKHFADVEEKNRD